MEGDRTSIHVPHQLKCLRLLPTGTRDNLPNKEIGKLNPQVCRRVAVEPPLSLGSRRKSAKRECVSVRFIPYMEVESCREGLVLKKFFSFKYSGERSQSSILDWH